MYNYIMAFCSLEGNVDKVCDKETKPMPSVVGLSLGA